MQVRIRQIQPTRAVGLFDQVAGFKPPGEQGARGGRRAKVIGITPRFDLFANRRHERRKQSFIGGTAQAGAWPVAGQVAAFARYRAQAASVVDGPV